MTKLLISLLALDIGVSLSKVFIFTWESSSLDLLFKMYKSKLDNSKKNSLGCSK